MVFLIIALLAILLLLSYDYIIRLEPAGVFSLMWGTMTITALGMQHFLNLHFTGILFIVICILLFQVGSIFSNTCYIPLSSEKKTLVFNEKRAVPILIVLFIAAFFNPIYTLSLHGFSMKSLFNMAALLYMNKEIAVERYSGSEASNFINQFFLIFSYASPLFGGFCYRLVKRPVKILCLFTVLPGIFVAFTQSMKMGMMTSFNLWICSFIVCSYSYNLPLRIKLKHAIWGVVGLAAFFFMLFISMVFRTGVITDRVIADISEKFVTYAIGHMSCFDTWYASTEVVDHKFGIMTFMGISNQLGLVDRIQGIYHEFLQIGKNGFFGISNVYTIFRMLIEDFGEFFSFVIMLVLGFAANASMKNIVARNLIFFNQTFAIAIYAYILWSYVTSFFAYTSYIAMFFLSYFILKFIQSKRS